MIERIEGFSAELDPGEIARFWYRRVLYHGDIEGGDAGTVDRIASQIADLREIGSVQSRDRHRVGKTLALEKVVVVLLRHVRGVTGTAGTVQAVGQRERVGVGKTQWVARDKRSKRQPGGHAEYAAELIPAASNLYETIALARVRKGVETVDDEILRDVEVRGTLETGDVVREGSDERVNVVRAAIRRGGFIQCL